MHNLPTKACNGCSACEQVCPVHAIRMESNNEGFLYPIIDESACINCNHCEVNCPVLNVQKRPCDSKRIIACGCINTDDETRKNSSSGGMFSIIAEYVIRQGGIVFGAKFAGDFSIIHGWTDSIEGLAELRGSKYVQSRIGNSYKECKRFLETGKLVLFSGTPCQIGALKAFLAKNYENLLCIDLICHGIPSPLVWEKYIAYREALAGSATRNIAFRDKHHGWKLYSIVFSFANATEYRNVFHKDPYMQLFLKDIILRQSCYNCAFKTIDRQSDITLADFWGVETLYPELFDNKGTSLVFIHSESAQAITQSLKSCYIYKQVEAEKAIAYNLSMIQSVRKSIKRDKFFAEFSQKPMEFIIKKYAYDSFLHHIYKILHKCLGNILGEKGVKLIKKVLGK